MRTQMALPGFRSGTWWKKLIAVLGYLTIAFFVWVGVSGYAYGLTVAAVGGILTMLIANSLGLRSAAPMLGSASRLTAAIGWAILGAGSFVAVLATESIAPSARSSAPVLLSAGAANNAEAPMSNLLPKSSDAPTRAPSPTLARTPSPTAPPTQSPLVAATPLQTQAPAALATPLATTAPAAAPTAAPVPMLSITITASTYGFLASTTTPGASCSASGTLPSGGRVTSAGLQVTKFADGNGNVSWSYQRGTNTLRGSGSHSIACTYQGQSARTSASFIVQ